MGSESDPARPVPLQVPVHRVQQQDLPPQHRRNVSTHQPDFLFISNFQCELKVRFGVPGRDQLDLVAHVRPAQHL